MKVFVAGATGAVGRPMVQRLVAAGHAVTAMSRRPAALDELSRLGVRGVACDVYDLPRLREVVQAAAPDAVVHQLTDLPATLDPRQLAAVYNRNDRVRREGTRNLVEAAQAAGVPRLVVQSMASWYSPVGDMVKSEEDPLWTDAPEPLGQAVRTVVEMERMVLEGVAVPIVLRYGGFYGPGTWYSRESGVAGMMRKRLVPMVGDGSAVTSLLHVDDAAAAAVAALGEVPPGIYNVADSHPAPIADWMPAFAVAIGAPAPLRAPAFVARLAIGRAMTAWLTLMRGASNARALATLGWAPAYPNWREGFRTL